MKIDPVLFEQLLSFRPQLASHQYAKEPCLRALIFSHYEKCNMFTPESVDDFTKDYIAKLFAQFGEQTNAAT